MTALTILFDLLRVETERLSTFASPPTYRFADALWSRIYTGLVAKPLRADVKTEFLLRYLNHFDDIRYYFLRETASQADKSDATRVLTLLEAIDSMPSFGEAISTFWAGAPSRRVEEAAARPKKKRKREDGSTGIFDAPSEEDEAPQTEAKAVKQKLPTLLDITAHRKTFSAAWFAMLPQLKSEGELKRVLVVLHSRIMPHLHRPAALMDWLADCCDAGALAPLVLAGAPDGNA